jgi:hypothetical protein
MKRRVPLAFVAGLLLAALHAGAAAADSGMQFRPTAGGEFAYATPERTFAGRNLVVHWVSRGDDAPPLNDDDANGVPDNVEQIASAGDKALDFYAGRGFRAPLPDLGGPDGRPDVYLVQLPFGIFGYMAPAYVSWDGSFVVLSANLDRREPVALGSLRTTVGHELFHVVQQAYVGELPPWVAEGTADALASLAAPEAHDFADELRQPRWASRAATGIADNDPYAASAFWRFLELREPGIVAALLQRRSTMKPLAEAGDPSWYRSLEAVYRARGKDSFDAAFGRFARGLLLQRVLGPIGTMRAGDLEIAACSPLSIRVLRLALPAHVRRVELEVTGTGQSPPHVQLVLPEGRTIVARPAGRSARLRAALRGGEQFGARLVVTGRALAAWGGSATVHLAVD